MIPRFRAWDTFDEEMVNDIFFSWQDCGYESLNECLSDERWKFMQSTGQLVRGIVKYDPELGFWGMTDVRFNDLRAIGYLANQRVTVLGNIYQNKELGEVEL